MTFNFAYVDGHAASARVTSRFPAGNWRTDPDGYPYWIRSGDTRWDCRPDALIPDLPGDHVYQRKGDNDDQEV